MQHLQAIEGNSLDAEQNVPAKPSPRKRRKAEAARSDGASFEARFARTSG